MPSMLMRSNFRPGLPSGAGGEQRPVRSNFSSGLGDYQPSSDLTPLNDSPADTGVKRTTVPAPQPAKSLTPVSRPGAAGSPNRGGTITRNGITTTYAPSPGQNTNPNRPNKGGTITRNISPGVNATTVVPPSPAAIRSQLTPALPTTLPAVIQPALDSPGAPVAAPSTVAAPQTESNNPLTGDGNAESGGTTDEIDPGSALGLNRRGASVPSGTDALPADGNVGGTGLYARKFGNPKSANIYGSYVRKLFGNEQV